MRLNRLRSIGKSLAGEMLGSFLVAIGIYNFAAGAGFPMTGFSGIAIILNRLFGAPIGILTILLNIPVAAVSFKLLGRDFFLRSVRCILISSIMTDFIAPLLPVYAGNRLLAAICTGVISGLGYALIYMQSSSTGGSDFVIMAVKALNPHISIGNIAFCIDLFVVLAGGFIFKDVDGIIYGLIVSFLMAGVVDKVMYGINAGKMALVVTERGMDVAKAIDACCGRGSTLLKAEGGYQQDAKQVVMCACNNKQMFLLQKAVKQVDPSCFVIIVESNEVHGEGFQPLQVGIPK